MESLGKGVLGLGSSDLFLSAGLIELHELGEIELGLLEDLDLLDEPMTPYIFTQVASPAVF